MAICRRHIYSMIPTCGPSIISLPCMNKVGMPLVTINVYVPFAVFSLLFVEHRRKRIESHRRDCMLRLERNFNPLLIRIAPVYRFFGLVFFVVYVILQGLRSAWIGKSKLQSRTGGHLAWRSYTKEPTRSDNVASNGRGIIASQTALNAHSYMIRSHYDMVSRFLRMCRSEMILCLLCSLSREVFRDFDQIAQPIQLQRP